MPEFIMKCFIGALLLFAAIQDIRRKKISTWIIIAGLILVTACVPFTKSIALIDRGLGLLVGMSVVGISKGTGGKIGMGDGLILCITGIGLGFWNNLELFAMALFAAAVISILLLAMRLVNRKKSIPFVPFLFIGYLIIFMNTRPWTGTF